ncbi:MAG TPA: beta-galactosidase trimerization domain-containing protein [Bryobacteraceae bacterium]|nr:beta-galactosidase trimerization domain-containing protein [Bryobacteraceae bacterium]
MNRREFMQATVAGAMLPLSAMPQGQHPVAPQANWYDRPMRWAQIAFVEDDPGNYSQSFWIDYLRRIHADAACLSAGGCVAFYPTKIPMHYRSKWLGDRDTFGDLVKGCRELGMNVVARTDPHAVHQDVYDAHPDWIMVNAKGEKVRHAADKELWVTCALGPYNFDYMTKVTEEIVTLYSVDGIFTNRWAGSGMCYCEHCQENFRAFSHMDLPRTLDPQNPNRREYIVWHQQRLFELWRLWDSRIKAINPNASYLANAGGGALSELDMTVVGQLAPTLFADRQARRGVTPPWENGKNGKEYRATMGRKAIAGIFSVGLEEQYRWKDSVQNGDEIRLWVADGMAQGLRLWFTKFNAKPIDKRWLPVVEELYTWNYANEKYLRNIDPLARVAIVYSQQTAAFYGGPKAHAKVEDPALGFYHALIEARIPFEMVHDRYLDAEHLAPYRTLILPNIAALNTKQCEQLEAFVKRGGSLVATYETSLYDEWGVKRKDFGLASLFGVSFTGKMEGPMQNSYLTLEKDPSTGRFHPLLAGFEDATRIINGANRVEVTAGETSGSVFSPLTVVPSYPDLPMESVFVRPAKTHDPGVYLREVGEGRVVYFPWDIDRTFWEVLDVDHGKLIANAVLWANKEPQPLTVKGSGVLDVSIWTQKDSMTVHLVNLTNPMMMKGPVREVIPIGRQQVRLRVPAGKRVRKAHLLVAKRDVPHHEVNGFIEVEVPGVALHEVIALDFAV